MEQSTYQEVMNLFVAASIYCSQLYANQRSAILGYTIWTPVFLKFCSSCLPSERAAAFASALSTHRQQVMHHS